MEKINFADSIFVSVDKSFEKRYSIELSKLRPGKQDDDFSIENDFFNHFEHSPVNEGNLKIHASIDRFETHIVVELDFSGFIMLECDRCTELYKHEINAERRVVFAYDTKLDQNTDDIVLIDRNSQYLELAREFFESIILEVPIRKVPEAEIHICPPEVLAILEEGAFYGESEGDEKEDPVDPRWEKLKDLKKKKG